MLTDVQVDEKIAALESTVSKQQAEIKQLKLVGETCQKAILEIAALLTEDEEESSNDGLR